MKDLELAQLCGMVITFALFYITTSVLAPKNEYVWFSQTTGERIESKVVPAGFESLSDSVAIVPKFEREISFTSSVLEKWKTSDGWNVSMNQTVPIETKVMVVIVPDLSSQQQKLEAWFPKTLFVKGPIKIGGIGEVVTKELAREMQIPKSWISVKPTE
jgi:hypothetical protein